MDENRSSEQIDTEQVNTPVGAPEQMRSPGSEARIEVKLDEILQQLKQLTRLQRHRDFSMVRLIGTVAQLIVVALIFWTIVGLTDLTDSPVATGTTFKLLGAILLQILALTFFILDRQDR